MSLVAGMSLVGVGTLPASNDGVAELRMKMELVWAGPFVST